MNSKMKRRNFAVDLNDYVVLLEAMQDVEVELSNISQALHRLYSDDLNYGPQGFLNTRKAIEYWTEAMEDLEKHIEFERSDFSREFASEAGVVGLLIDQLANSMEFFDEEGWVEFLGPDLDENSAREIYKNYWLISPNDRLKWNDSQWGTWLERYI